MGLTEDLEALADLYQRGVISEAQFRQAKRRLVGVGNDRGGEGSPLPPESEKGEPSPPESEKGEPSQKPEREDPAVRPTVRPDSKSLGRARPSSPSSAKFTYGKLALVAAMPVVAIVVVGLLVGLVLLIADDFVAAEGIADSFRLLAHIVSLLLGSTLEAPGTWAEAALDSLPLTGPVVGAWLIYRFAGQHMANKIVPVLGWLMTAGMLFLLAALFSIVKLETNTLDSVSSPSLVAALLGSLIAWGGGYAISRSITALRGGFVASVLGLGGALVAPIYMVISDASRSISETFTTLVTYIIMAGNFVAFSLYFTFTGKIGYSGQEADLASVGDLVGGDELSVSLPSAAAENGWLWILFFTVIAGVAIWGWISPHPASASEMRARAGRTAVGMFGVLWIGHVAGALRVSGPSEESITYGAVAVPWSMIVPAALIALLWSAAVWVRAYQAGAEWAAVPDLNDPQAASLGIPSRVTEIGRRLRESLKELAETPPGGNSPVQSESSRQNGLEDGAVNREESPPPGRGPDHEG